MVVFSIYRNAWNFFNYGGASAQAIELTVWWSPLHGHLHSGSNGATWSTNRMRRVSTRHTRRLLDLVSYGLLLLGGVLMVGPFLWMVSTSFKLPADQFTKTLIPPTFTLDNFRQLFSVDLEFPAAVLEQRLHFDPDHRRASCLPAPWRPSALPSSGSRGGTCSSRCLLLTLLIPPQVTLIPNFIIFKYLHLIGTSVPLWLPAFWGGAFGTFLLRQYFLTIPRDLVDAARVDGASLPEIFWKIYMPLGQARPGCAGHLHLPGCLERPAASAGLHAVGAQHHADRRSGLLPDSR